MLRTFVANAILLGLLIAPVIYAQSDGEPTPDETATDPAPVIEVPIAPAVYAPAYLEMAGNMPFAVWEMRLNETLRMYRLGVMTLTDAQEQLRELDGAALGTAAQLRTLIPPPQFAHVQELNIAAAVEYAASFESGLTALSGNETALGIANNHFSRAQDLAYQARLELR